MGGFPKPDRAILEAPEALRKLHGVVARMRGKWVFPRARLYTVVWMRGRWVFPRARIVDTIYSAEARKTGVSPGENCSYYV